MICTLKQILRTRACASSRCALDVSQDRSEANFQTQALAEAFLGLICDTVSYMSSAMRDICQHIQMNVSAKFPDSVYTTIGGWIFLRYINPAVISPDLVDVDIPVESRDVRRTLLLITKVNAIKKISVQSNLSLLQLLQALSNNIRFKEPGMKSLNSFVEHVSCARPVKLCTKRSVAHIGHDYLSRRSSCKSPYIASENPAHRQGRHQLCRASRSRKSLAKRHHVTTWSCSLTLSGQIRKALANPVGLCCRDSGTG